MSREPVRRAESLAQYSRKRRRCHRRTASVVTITRGALHPAQTPASQNQKRRSAVRSLGRAVVLLYTASCCRRTRFSTASWRWPLKKKGKSRSRWSRRVIIEPGLCLDQDRQINRVRAGHGFGEGQRTRATECAAAEPGQGGGGAPRGWGALS